MKKTCAPAVLGAVAAGLLGAGSASAGFLITIDDFDDQLPDQHLTTIDFPGIFSGTVDGVTRNTDSSMQNGLAGVFGGERDAFVEGIGAGSNITIAAFSGMMSYSSAFGRTGILTLDYGVRSSLNADFSLGDAILFEGLSGDLDDSNPVRPVPLTITIVSGAGTGSEVTAMAMTTLIADGDYEIPFASFAGIDFSDIDSLSFKLDGTDQQAIDYAFSAIRVVPAPASLAMFGLAAPIALRRKRQR